MFKTWMKGLLVFVVLLVIGGPATIFGLKVIKVSYDYAFGRESQAAQADAVLAIQAQQGDTSAVALLNSQDNLQRAVRGLQTAQKDDEGISTAMAAAELSQRRVDYSLRQIMAAFEGISPDGKTKRQFEAGDVVRYYPLEKSLTLPGDTRLYVCVGVDPYATGCFFWIPQEILGQEKLEKPRHCAWEPFPSDDSKVLKCWAITLAPGQESPAIQIVPEVEINYHVDFDNRDMLMWSFNGGQWEPIPHGLPAIKGVAQIKFRLSPYAKEVEPVKVTIRKNA